MAAHLTLLGLYPPSNLNISINHSMAANTLPEYIPWPPIPVYTVPKSTDHVGLFR